MIHNENQKNYNLPYLEYALVHCIIQKPVIVHLHSMHNKLFDQLILFWLHFSAQETIDQNLHLNN